MSSPSDPYVVGLQLLARRELSVAQLRGRLRKRSFSDTEIERALMRLQGERALDDVRTALAYARTTLRLKVRGRARILTEIKALGISADTARAAVDATFEGVEEGEILERALARRLTGPILDRNHLRRLHRALLRQGFPSEMIVSALMRRSSASADGE